MSLFDSFVEDHAAADVFAAKTGRAPYVQPPAAPGSTTSALAAEAIIPHVSGQQAKILEYLQRCGPASCETLCHLLAMPGDSVRPRLVELRAAGLVEKVGEGLTTKGRRCDTYGAVA